MVTGTRAWGRVALLVAAIAGSAMATTACGGADPNLPAAGSVEPDRFLYDRGVVFLQKKNWLAAREYFAKLINTYPNSPLRQDAKLGVGDSYLGEKQIDSLILAVNEFREFLQFFPTSPRADYAMMKVCQGTARQMLSAQRDQTATRDAIRECDAFLTRFPASGLRPEVEKTRREARDRLSAHEFAVGLTYYRIRVYIGAISRFSALLAEDPEYTRKDQVYFYLAETLVKLGSNAEALPVYDRLVREFPKSEHAKKAQERMEEIKRAVAAPGQPTR